MTIEDIRNLKYLHSLIVCQVGIILSHMMDDKGNNWFRYLVDEDETGDSYIIFCIEESEINDYFNNKITLHDLIKGSYIKEGYLFKTDYNDSRSLSRLDESMIIPGFLPHEDSYWHLDIPDYYKSK